MSEKLEATGYVVVGTDLSHHADRAVDWAAARAEAQNLPLLVVLALPEVPIPRRSRLYEAMQEGDYVAALHRRGTERLEELQRTLTERHPGLRVETRVLTGRASYLLADASRTAELVVVGARGEGAPVRVKALGGTSDAVTSHAHGAVAVVREDTEPEHPGPVVVGVDDSAEAMAAISYAAREAASRGVPLVAVHAWDATPLLASGAGLWSVDPTQMGSALEEMVRDLVRPALDDHPGVELQVTVVPGRASGALVDAAHDASLLVVGSRGRHGFAGLLLGSTSREVLREASCPVVVIRR